MDTTKNEENRELVSLPSDEVPEDQRIADLNWAIGVNRNLLKVLGFWVYPNEQIGQTIRSNCQAFTFGVLLIVLLIIPQLLALNAVWGNLDLVIDNFITILPLFAAELKFLNTWYYKKVYAKLLNEIEEDWLAPKSQQQREIMTSYGGLARKISICGLVLAFNTSAYFHSLLWFGLVIRKVNNITDTSDRIFVFQSVYPYDTSSNFRYYSIVISQLIGSMLSSTFFTNSDLLFGLILLHTTGQLKNLADRIRKMADDDDLVNFKKIFKMNILEHYRLIRIVEMIEEVFSGMLLALFGSIALIYCMVGFQMHNAIKHSFNESQFFIAFNVMYMSFFLFLMFVYSWVGEGLTTQSEALQDATYNSNWILLNPEQRKQISLLIIRVQYPFRITAGKMLPISLQTYAALLKTSAGYMTFLLTIYG